MTENINKNFWNKVYETENVESHIFRPYGRIFKNLLPKGANILDYGCSRGAALKFYQSKGFNVYGVDISEVEISNAKKNLNDFKENIQLIDVKVNENDKWFDVDFDLIQSIQTLYYLTPQNLQKRLMSFYNMLKSNGYVYFSMMSIQHYFYKYSKPADNGMRMVSFKTKRQEVKSHYIYFVESEEHLKEIFKMFKPLHIGFYSHKFRSDEGASHHYTFIGQKVD